MFLRAMRSWFNNLFLNSEFSDFAYLGNLSQYDLSEMQSQLSTIWKEETKVYETFQIVTWSNTNSSYSICYTLSGVFVQIKEESWKKEKITYSYELNSELLYLKQAV